MNFIYVAIGGALGAMLRYSLNYLPVSTAFPFKTRIGKFSMTSTYAVSSVIVCVLSCFAGIAVAKYIV